MTSLKEQKWIQTDSAQDAIYIQLSAETPDGDLLSVLDTTNLDNHGVIAKYEMRIVFEGQRYQRGLSKTIFNSITLQKAIEIADSWVELQKAKVNL